MIKWAGFGKLLKQSFLILLISFFISLGNFFVSADYLHRMGSSVLLDDKGNTCSISSNLSINCSKSNSVLGRSRGTTFTGMNGIFFTENGIGVFHNDSRPGYSFQGILTDGFSVCSGDFSVITGGSTISFFPNCGGYTKVGNRTYENLLEKLSSQSPKYRRDGTIYAGATYSLVYDDFYFSIMVDGYGSLGNLNGNFSGFDFGFNGLRYTDINRFNNYVVSYPLGSISGGSQQVSNPVLTGNVTYSTCTNSKALSYYNIQGYKKNLCYSSYGNNNDIYISSGSVSDFVLTGLDISEVWLDTAGYRRYGNTGTGLPYNDWFQYWRKSFEIYNTSYNTSGSVSNPFVGVPVSLFTLFGNVYTYGVAYTNQSIIEYCDLLLFAYPDDPYEGILGDLPCNYSAIDILSDTIGVHAESGQVVQGSSWDGILNRPGYHLDLGRNSGFVASGSNTGLSYFGDGKTFINNSFNTLSNSFRFPDRSSNGIIPNYILVFMFALILFRFISH